MRPPAFAFARPDTLGEALELLNEYGEDARPLAGGQSLIPLMKLRVVYPGVLVDLNRIPGLASLTLDDHWLTIGALTRHVDVQRHAAVRSALPVVAEAVDNLADVQVRNLGTVVGSAAEADPSGDWAPVMLALGGEVVCRSASRSRTIPVNGFFVDYLTSDLAPNELIESIRIRRPSPRGSGSGFLKLERRVGDFAVVSAAVSMIVDDDDRCVDIGIGIGGVGLTAFKAKDAEDVLRGSLITESDVDEAIQLVRANIAPLDDGRGPAWYKRDMAGVYLRRSLLLARERCRASRRPEGGGW